MDSQNIKPFRARRHLKLITILYIINFFAFLFFPGNLKIGVGLPILLIIRTIWQYNLVYISIGEDFITYQPAAPLRKSVSILFKEITSVSYKNNKVIINYINKISNKQYTVNIPLSIMEDAEKEKLLSTLHIILKDKEI
ncbi:hypothetical protein J3T98_02950 [Gilliamella sp. B2772]|uniref:hypothetical protein n=1 Tax=Gilliamella sp. B2772 TaxID=2817981 RepID=UPI00226A3095|nr:hypothetical protein [Gilliamella sp. B2772]MCX8659913.1 hypothetical protein [Gilliamella sp. B2772]